MTDLSAYMAESIRGIMKSAYLNVLSNPREARFVARMQRTFTTSGMETHGRMHTL